MLKLVSQEGLMETVSFESRRDGGEAVNTHVLVVCH